MNVLVIGGSRNVGFYAALRFLRAGYFVTFLLRNTSVFDQDADIQGFISSGKAKLAKGDALVKDDVQNAWKLAASHGGKDVDLLLFTLGGTPKFSLTKGVFITPPDLVTRSFINTLSTLPSPHPRIIVITSIGLSKDSHASLPLLLKPLYSTLIAAPHRDKVGVERLVAHCSGWEWNERRDGEIHEEILSGNWSENLPALGTHKDFLVIRPALFTDGECLAENPGAKKYRVSEQELGGYTISRRDVAHFVVDAAMNRWDEFAGKKVNIAY